MIDICFGILMELLKKRKVTARYISEKYEISLRTVYRYIDVLSANNIAVFCTRGRNGGIQIADNYRLPAALLTASEQENIFTALNLLKGARPDVDIEAIRDKFIAVNTGDSAGGLVMTGDKLILDGTIGDGTLYLKKIGPLTKAVDNNLVTEIVYRDRGGGTTERYIQPHAFVLKDMVWYIYAFCELRQSFRMFKISRIEKLSITGRNFVRKPREEFTPWKLSYKENAPAVELLLYIDEFVRYDVEEWLGVECVKPQKNARYPYIASAEVYDNPQLLSRLMSYGAHIKIMHPSKLKNSLTAAADELLRSYLI